MRLGWSLAPRRRAVASGTALAVAASTLVVLAIRSEGFPISDVNLNDGAVWVTKNDDAIIGRLNSQVKELDLGIVSNVTNQDLFQAASDVQVFDADSAGQRKLLVADVVLGKFAEPLVVPDSVTVAAGRTTVAMLDSKSGSAWVRRADAMAGFKADPTQQTTKVSANGAVAVGRDGAAYFLDTAEGVVRQFVLDAQGVAVEGAKVELGTELNSGAALTVVGSTPVVWDAKAAGGGLLYLPGEKPVRIDDADGAKLQQPGPDADATEIATETQLWKVPLAGGDPVAVSNIKPNGTPAAPVVVDGWVHAAWADPDSKNYTRIPLDDENSDGYEGGQVDLDDDAELIFRINRKVVVLNDAFGGTSWMVQLPGLDAVENWDAVDPRKNQPTPDEQETDDKDSKNQPPTAVKDEFGARPGTTVTLPVTLNDKDPDGDLLVVSDSPLRDERTGTAFALVGDGTQVQARVPGDASGTVEFKYSITDGRDDHKASSAQVKLAIIGDGTDRKPTRIKGQENELTVASGRHASVNVLPAWIDPDGDSLTLTDADSKDGKVHFRPDGTIEFHHTGGSSSATIAFTVQGGKEQAKGSVAVTVVGPKKALPTVVPDHASGFAGQALILEPTKNDIDPTGGKLQVPSIKVVEGAGATVTPDSARGTAVFTAPAGTYFLKYTAQTSERKTSKPALIRVDIKPRQSGNAPPVAAKDTAVVQVGRSELVDLLANDVDPDGDVLVVRGITVPESGACAGTFKVSLINRRFARVESVGGVEGQCEFAYSLTDGRSEGVEGAVSVIGGPATENRNPVAEPDVVAARAGTLLTIPILANDSDPDGDKLTVNAADIIDAADLPVVTTGSDVRVLVPKVKTGGQRTFTYQVHDGQGGSAVASVTLNIKPDDPKINSAPQPPPIEDRTIEGQKVRVSIDLAGADPDGDPLAFVGLAQSPTLGRMTASGTNWFEYEPFESVAGHTYTGTDAFKVTVADPYGDSTVADVRIGIGARAPFNQAPAALDDALLVRPGTTIQFPVLANDSDPDGDSLELDDKVVASNGVEAKVSDGRIVELTAPKSEGITSATYSVSDGLGGASVATLTVTASKRAPEYAPLTRDDVVPASEIVGKSAGDTATVDVVANDGDLDGSKDDLELEAIGDDTSEKDGKLRVTLKSGSRVVAYRVKDADDNSAYGIVYVGGTDRVPPTLNPDEVPVKAKAGKPVTIDLNDVVRVRSGRSPRIIDPAKIDTDNGTARADGDHAVVFTAPSTGYGPMSLTLGVHDGEKLNDPEGLSAQLTIPIDVEPSTNIAPSVRSTEVRVASDDKKSVELDLKKLASDPNDGDSLTFELTGQDDGVGGEVRGDRVRVWADGAKPGARVPLALIASDGKASATGKIVVVVTKTVAPPMTLQLQDKEGKVGEPITFDLADSIISDPFPDETKTAVLQPAPSCSCATIKGTTLTVTPKEHGTLTVTYSMGDGSGDGSRDVVGQVKAVVADKPDAPGLPTATQDGPGSVRLIWSAPADNGKPIDGYRISANGAELEEVGAVPTAVIDGLDPGTRYTFTVAAHNEVGWSEMSPESNGVTANEVPGQVTDLVVVQTDYTDRDQKLRLTWGLPENAGSAITGYIVTVSGGTATVECGSGGSCPAAARATVISNLTNGTTYTFTVRAVNKKGKGPDSPPVSDSPFTTPDAPGFPTLNPSAAEGLINVAWGAMGEPEDGFDTVTRYRVTLFRGSAPVAEKDWRPGDSGTPAVVFETVETGGKYRATVSAENRAGFGPEATSAETDFYQAASAPTNIQHVSDGDRSGRFTFTTPAENGGYAVTSYLVQTSDGRSTTLSAVPTGEGVASGTQTVAFNTNSYSGQAITVTPHSTNGSGQDVPGTPAMSGPDFRPYGAPNAPTVSAAAYGDKQVNLAWNASGSPNGRPVKTEISIDGGAWQVASSTGSQIVGNDYAQEHRISARVTETDVPGSPRTVGSSPPEAKASSPIPPKQAYITKLGANSFSITYRSFDNSCTENYRIVSACQVKCWNDYPHANASTREPDYLGLAARYQFEHTPDVRVAGPFSCPSPPPSGVFSVEIEGQIWVPAIQW